MKRRIGSKEKRWGMLAVLLLVLLVSCGKKEQPAPQPAPPPTNPNPAPGTGGGVGGACGNIGATDFPLRKDGSPYYGNLVSQYGGGAINSLALQIFYSGYTSADRERQNIVGTGTFTFNDLIAASSYPNPNQQASFCVSSSSLQSGQPLPGIFNSRSFGIALTLQGLVQVPLHSPYSGYPGGYYPGNSGGSHFSQELVTISIGGSYGCQAYLYQGRIVGCADITIGPTGSRRYRYRID